MFSPFSSPRYTDAVLGELRRKGGYWRGTIALGESSVPLILDGPRSSPDPRALALAHAIAHNDPTRQDQIAAALFEHAAPYTQPAATTEMETPTHSLPRLTKPADVWPHASVVFVAVIPLQGELVVEIGYQVAWDEEHTLGARLRDGRLIELNGSVLSP